MRRTLLVLAVAGWALFLAGAQAATSAGPGPALALLPVQDQAGDPRAVLAVEQALRGEFARFSQALDAEVTRTTLRRLRLRNGNDAPPEALRRLAEELGVDWLVAATLHEAGRRGVPSLTVSMRAYRGDSGELFWADFRGGSGLDGRTVLGLGEIRTLELLAPRVVQRLTEDLWDSLAGDVGEPARPRPSAGEALGSLAIVPFAGLTGRDATVNAETVTEAARAATHRLGARSVSPGCTSEVLRRQGLVGWGGVDADARAALRELCGADAILTGSVELYDVGGGEQEPEPRASIAIRLVEADSGRIAWMGAAERRGWDRQGLFRLGRVYSRGALTEEMMNSLARRLLRERTAASEGDGVGR